MNVIIDRLTLGHFRKTCGSVSDLYLHSTTDTKNTKKYNLRNAGDLVLSLSNICLV